MLTQECPRQPVVSPEKKKVVVHLPAAMREVEFHTVLLSTCTILKLPAFSGQAFHNVYRQLVGGIVFLSDCIFTAAQRIDN